MRRIYATVGLPGSGKTTAIREIKENEEKEEKFRTK